MKQKDLDNLSKDELFKVIKDKCKSRSKLTFWGGMTIIVLGIISLIASIIHNKGIQNLQSSQIVAFIFLVLLVCLCGLYVLNNYRFLQRNDRLDTPDELLYGYNKKIQNDLNISFVIKLIFVGYLFYQALPDFRDDLPTLIFLIVSVLILVYLGRGSSFALSRDLKIIEQLQKLTEKE